jgi:hypothetical protein
MCLAHEGRLPEDVSKMGQGAVPADEPRKLKLGRSGSYRPGVTTDAAPLN